MPDYRIHLHQGLDAPPSAETLTADDHAAAMALAEVRLLLTSEYTHVVVSIDGQPIGFLKRDSQPHIDDLARPETAGLVGCQAT